MTRRIAVGLALGALLSAGCCRLRTIYHSEITTQCMAEATSADASPPDPKGVRERCEACCRRHDLSVVEPGYCSCGEMGLDALMK